MSITLRVCIFNGNVVRRFSERKYNDLIEGRVAIPECSSTLVKIAQGTIALKDRKPSNVMQVHYLLIPCNEKGILDMSEERRKCDLVMSNIMAKVSKPPKSILKELKHKIREQYKKFTWKPTLTEKKIAEALFLN